MYTTKKQKLANLGILSAIGNTPLIELTRICCGDKFRLFAKLESLNPGGSIKDRPAFMIIKSAMDEGVINSESVVIESSSGNMGIGLAQACSYFGLRFICVVDPKTSKQNIRLMKVYGAEVECIREPDPVTKEYLRARLDRVNELLGLTENGFWPNQYSSTRNSLAHYQTMHEIASALDGEIDYLFCAVSTCGTLRGCAEYVKKNKLKTKIIAVDAVGSVIFGGRPTKRLIPGHGAAVRPGLFCSDLTDQYVHVSDWDCVIGCHRLLRKEAILAGGSSGGVIRAVEIMAPHILPNTNCVAILPDRGERYLDTIYSDDWVRAHFSENPLP